MRVTVPSQDLFDRLSPDLPQGVELQVWDFTRPVPQGRIDLAVLPYMAKPTLLDQLAGSGVAWVQSQALGHDGVEDHLPEDIGYSNAVGVHEASTAELALALTLAAQRDLPTYIAAQPEGSWHQEFSPGTFGLTALVVGVGGVGSAIAHLLRACGMTVLRSASHARRDEFGEIAGPDQLPELLPTCDVVVLATPLTEATHHLADAAFLQQMKNGALLVNIGRGPLVDSDALVEAASSGHVRAALDVTDPEPLPSDHPLWRTQGVLITPHVGGRTSSMFDRVEQLVRRQINHLAAGEPLDFAVDLGR